MRDGRVVGVEVLHWLQEIRVDHRQQVGETAFHLGQLAQQSWWVPPTFVIPAPWFHRSLGTMAERDPMGVAWPDSRLYWDLHHPRQLQAIARKIRQGFPPTPLDLPWESLGAASQACFPGGVGWGKVPPALVLRPSFGGTGPLQALESFLVPQLCDLEPSSFHRALVRLWSEVFRARSLYYWLKLGLRPSELTLAVYVQPLWPAIASGRLVVGPEGWKLQAMWGLEEVWFRGEGAPILAQGQWGMGPVQGLTSGHQSLAYTYGTYFPLGTRAWQKLPTVHPRGDRELPQGVEAYLLPEISADALVPQLLQSLQTGPFQTIGPASPPLAPKTLAWTYGPQGPEDGQNPQVWLTQVQQDLDQGMAPTQGVGGTGKGGDEEASVILVRGLAAATGQAIAKAFVLHHDLGRGQVPPDTILVARAIAPDQIALLQQAVGIITEQGGMTCHSAIVARELGIPAVVGALEARQRIQTGDLIHLDGDRGQVYRAVRRVVPLVAPPAPPLGPQGHPVTVTPILVSLSQPQSLGRAVQLPVAGVGLLRSELMLLEVLGGKHPLAWLREGQGDVLLGRWVTRIQAFAQAFWPRPVFYRSLDLRPHEYHHLQGHDHHPGTNPILGSHGPWSYQRDPQLFRLELAALGRLQEEGWTNLRLILPFVRSVEEFQFCRHQVMMANLDRVPGFELWIMAEVPSVIWLLPEYKAAGVQGLAVGTNDLTQLVMAADRDHPELARSFGVNHPAVQRAIAQLLTEAQRLGLPCTLCGEELARFPHVLETLVSLGIAAVSVDMQAVEVVQRAIALAEERLQIRALRGGPGASGRSFPLFPRG